MADQVKTRTQIEIAVACGVSSEEIAKTFAIDASTVDTLIGIKTQQEPGFSVT